MLEEQGPQGGGRGIPSCRRTPLSSSTGPAPVVWISKTAANTLTRRGGKQLSCQFGSSPLAITDLGDFCSPGLLRSRRLLNATSHGDGRSTTRKSWLALRLVARPLPTGCRSAQRHRLPLWAQTKPADPAGGGRADTRTHARARVPHCPLLPASAQPRGPPICPALGQRLLH